jgi:hypothetical protein
VLTIASGYDPLYLTRSVATGRENYYLSAVAGHGEPPGVWTGDGCPDLGLARGSRVENMVMERLHGAFLDPRDPAGTATLGRAPSAYAGSSDAVSARIARQLAAEPEATPERRDQVIAEALRDRRASVFFFDATFSVPKSVSLLHASLQVRAGQAREAGQEAEAGQWAGRAQQVWDAVMAANAAMLDYLQREAGYSRAGYHSARSGRFVDAHRWDQRQAQLTRAREARLQAAGRGRDLDASPDSRRAGGVRLPGKDRTGGHYRAGRFMIIDSRILACAVSVIASGTRQSRIHAA